MQLATSFFLPTFSKNHILRIQNAWFRRRPRIQAVTQQDDLPRSRDLGGGETPLKSGEFLGVFFLIEQSPSRSHGDFFRRNWGDEDLQIVRRWARNERNSDEKPPGGSDMSAPQSRGFFRFMKLYQTLIYEVAGGSDKLMMRFWVFLGFSVRIFPAEFGIPGRLVEHFHAENSAERLDLANSAESKVRGKFHAPAIHPTHFRFCFFFFPGCI